jgi:hypothetical protein
MAQVELPRHHPYHPPEYVCSLTNERIKQGLGAQKVKRGVNASYLEDLKQEDASVRSLG